MGWHISEEAVIVESICSSLKILFASQVRRDGPNFELNCSYIGSMSGVRNVYVIAELALH